MVKPADRNLLEVVSRLPKLGVGTRVTRDSWEQYQNSYWEVTKVKPRSPNGKLGKVSCEPGLGPWQLLLVTTTTSSS